MSLCRSGEGLADNVDWFSSKERVQIAQDALNESAYAILAGPSDVGGDDEVGVIAAHQRVVLIRGLLG